MNVLTTEKIRESPDNNTVQRNSDQVINHKKSLWKKIAKNEILLITSSFRNHRKLFFNEKII